MLCRSHVWDDDFFSRGIKCTLFKVNVQLYRWQSHVQSMLLYASETWALSKQQLPRVEVFQMKCLRKICKVSLTDKIRHKIILGWCNANNICNMLQES